MVSAQPIGTGSIQWVGSLPAGEATIWRGRFALVDEQLMARTIQLPLRLLYVQSNGETAVHNETLTALFEKRAVADEGHDAATQQQRPLWLRILSGLVGLGAE